MRGPESTGLPNLRKNVFFKKKFTASIKDNVTVEMIGDSQKEKKKNSFTFQGSNFNSPNQHSNTRRIYKCHSNGSNTENDNSNLIDSINEDIENNNNQMIGLFKTASLESKETFYSPASNHSSEVLSYTTKCTNDHAVFSNWDSQEQILFKQEFMQQQEQQHQVSPICLFFGPLISCLISPHPFLKSNYLTTYHVNTQQRPSSLNFIQEDTSTSPTIQNPSNVNNYPYRGSQDDSDFSETYLFGTRNSSPLSPPQICNLPSPRYNSENTDKEKEYLYGKSNRLIDMRRKSDSSDTPGNHLFLESPLKHSVIFEKNEENKCALSFTHTINTEDCPYKSNDVIISVNQTSNIDTFPGSNLTQDIVNKDVSNYCNETFVNYTTLNMSTNTHENTSTSKNEPLTVFTPAQNNGFHHIKGNVSININDYVPNKIYDNIASDHSPIMIPKSPLIDDMSTTPISSKLKQSDEFMIIQSNNELSLDRLHETGLQELSEDLFDSDFKDELNTPIPHKHQDTPIASLHHLESDCLHSNQIIPSDQKDKITLHNMSQHHINDASLPMQTSQLFSSETPLLKRTPCRSVPKIEIPQFELNTPTTRSFHETQLSKDLNLKSHRRAIRECPLLTNRVLPHEKEVNILDSLLRLTSEQKNQTKDSLDVKVDKNHYCFNKPLNPLSDQTTDTTSEVFNDTIKQKKTFMHLSSTANSRFNDSTPPSLSTSYTRQLIPLRERLKERILSRYPNINSSDQDIVHPNSSANVTLTMSESILHKDNPNSPVTQTPSKQCDQTELLWSSPELTCDNIVDPVQHHLSISVTNERTPYYDKLHIKFPELFAKNSNTDMPLYSDKTKTNDFKAFKKKRCHLTNYWYNQFNETVFKKALPVDLVIEWNARLTKTAGQTLMSFSGEVKQRSCKIYLSCKVIDREKRLRSTLLHELCHVGQFLLQNEHRPAHGPGFQYWAKIATALYPEIPVTTTHNYDIYQPFRYQCTLCGEMYGRNSKVKDLKKQLLCRLPYCSGELKFLGCFDHDENVIPESARLLTPYNRFIQDKFSIVKQHHPDLSYKDLMALLAKEWRRVKQTSMNLHTHSENEMSTLLTHTT